MIPFNRRTFLKAAAAGAAAASAERRSEGAQRTTSATAMNQPKGLADVAVVGAGAFGGWTALYLREMGVNVTLIDQYGNARSSSGGETRQLRANYGNQEIYTRWALEAFTRWRTAAETRADPAR